MMVTNILGEQSFQVAFIQRNNVVQQVSPTASHPALRDAILPWTSEGSSLGNDPCRFERCDHLKPKLRIAIKDQVLVSGFKGKRLAQLLDDPSARRMLRDVNVQDVPPVMTDDEEAVEHAEGDGWHSKEIHGRNRFPMVSKEDQPALGPVRIFRRSLHPTGDGSLGKIKTEHAEFPSSARISQMSSRIAQWCRKESLYTRELRQHHVEITQKLVSAVCWMYFLGRKWELLSIAKDH